MVWLVCVLALWIYAGPGRSPERRWVLIEPGDAELIAQGENPLEIPSTWSFRTGDVLVLDNRDEVPHTIGDWTVGAGRLLEIPLRVSTPSLICTIHPDGQLTINVEPRRTDLQLTILPTLALGPALGGVILAVRRVVRTLEDPVPLSSVLS